MLSAAAIVLWIDRRRFSHAEERSNDGFFDKKGMIMMGLNERSLKYLVLDSGWDNIQIPNYRFFILHQQKGELHTSDYGDDKSTKIFQPHSINEVKLPCLRHGPWGNYN